MAWTYSNIQETTRQISGQISATTLTNSKLGQYINNYYQFDLPRELKIEELYVQYQFPLVKGQAAYDLPGDFADGLAYTHVEPRIYVNGRDITYTQDTNTFYSQVPLNFSSEQVGIGNGVTLAFAYTTQFSPIYNVRSPNSGFTQSANVLITDGVENFSDTPTGSVTGTLTGSLGGFGTVNYSTGSISVTFASAPSSSSVIEVTYHFQNESVPYICLFYARQFIFYPTPDTIYQCRIDSYQQPQAMVNPTDTPIKQEWAELIACGAALKILRDFGQNDKYQEVMGYFMRERSKVMSDTDNQLMATRTQPRF